MKINQALKKTIFQYLLQQSTEEDLPSYIPELTSWLDKVGCINDSSVKPSLYRIFQENGFHLVRNHFYGVLPDTRKFLNTWWDHPPYAYAFEQIRTNDIETLFERVLTWSSDLQSIPRDPADGFYWNNGMFPPLDAIVLYGVIREFQPIKIVEVGSGFSTEIALLAAGHTKSAIHCIEPYPGERLLSHRVELAALDQVRLEDVDLKVFKDLRANDILFIDTSHAVKIGSDVNHFLFNIFPRLAPGVLIHVHDIFLPYEYPRRWYDEVSIFWNEQYFLLAYLMQNPTVELLLPNFDLSVRHAQTLRERFKQFDIWNLTENLGGMSGASFWLRKT
jgi:hypothetical protein